MCGVESQGLEKTLGFQRQSLARFDLMLGVGLSLPANDPNVCLCVCVSDVCACLILCVHYEDEDEE